MKEAVFGYEIEPGDMIRLTRTDLIVVTAVSEMAEKRPMITLYCLDGSKREVNRGAVFGLVHRPDPKGDA